MAHANEPPWACIKIGKDPILKGEENNHKDNYNRRKRNEEDNYKSV